MKKNTVLKFLVIIALASMVLAACAPATNPNPSALPSKPGSEKRSVNVFVCYQAGDNIVYVETKGKAELKAVMIGSKEIVAWVWKDKNGVEQQPLPVSDQVTCYNREEVRE